VEECPEHPQSLVQTELPHEIRDLVLSYVLRDGCVVVRFNGVRSVVAVEDRCHLLQVHLIKQRGHVAVDQLPQAVVEQLPVSGQLEQGHQVFLLLHRGSSLFGGLVVVAHRQELLKLVPELLSLVLVGVKHGHQLGDCHRAEALCNVLVLAEEHVTGNSVEDLLKVGGLELRSDLQSGDLVQPAKLLVDLVEAEPQKRVKELLVLGYHDRELKVHDVLNDGELPARGASHEGLVNLLVHGVCLVVDTLWVLHHLHDHL